MPSSMGTRPLTSAFESPTFGEDSSFRVEQPVGSMSISPCGRDVVLASKEGLHVIDLDSPYSPPRYLPHHTPWEVADVQWSPFAARDYWVVSTSNQKALVWNLAMKTWQNSIEYVLHAHSRAITDINFHAHHPDVLATCAVDSFVHCWDLRVPARPAISFSDWFAGATQVKWNRQDPHVIASSHDRFLRIWDDRMGASPLRSIEAHTTKIYGLDWNRVRPGALVTCSLDKTIKFWDYTVECEVPEKLIKTPFPVWRARNTPFGWGVLAMPQRGNSDLHLYSRRVAEDSGAGSDLPLVHSFPGHKGQVKEFLWRARGGVSDGVDHREFQLVTWGTDRELRLHRVDPDILKRVGYEKGKSFISTLNVTRRGAVYKSFRDENTEPEFDEVGSPFLPGLQSPNQSSISGAKGMTTISMPYSRGWTQSGHSDLGVGMRGRSRFRADTNPITWMRGVKISGWDIETLGDEISHVGEKFTKVAFDSVDVKQRKATISLHGPWAPDGSSLFLKVDIKFPSDYPKSSVPTFGIQKTAAVTDQLSTKIISDMIKIAETYLSRQRGCLEGVVRYLLGESSLEDSVAWIMSETTETVKSPINGVLGGEESSDEDEVGLSHSQDLGMSSELLLPVNANVMVPVAKACGALWAPDGRLVCFFPPKRDKSIDVLDALGLREMTRLSRSDKVFEGFGRFQTGSPGPKITGTIASTDDGASDYSDDSYAESSSSSGSSDILSGLQSRFPAPPTWRSAGSFGFHRPRSTDNSQRSTAGAVTVKSEAPYNIVYIYDFNYLLPAKKELASKYRICGKGTDVCAHNAAVALDAGYPDLAQVWGLVKLILHNQTTALPYQSLELFDRRGISSTRKDSAVDVSYDLANHDQCQQLAASGAIQWGDHPFGGRWLIPALLSHFERIGDIQMVAMLSCVLHEINSGLRKDQRQDKTPSKRMEQHSFTLDLYSGHTTTYSRSQAVTPLTATPKESHTTPITYGSGRSSSELLRVDSTPPYSTGTTPPLTSRATTDRRFHSHNVSIAASPDQQSQPRSGSGFGSVLASSLSRSFTFGPSSASPPTTLLNKKKVTPNGSPNTGPPGVWTTGAFAGKPVSAVPDYLTASSAVASHTHSDTESERPDQAGKKPVRLKVSFKNLDSFDNDGHAHNSFLDPSKERLYQSYRTAYADLLFIWDLPVQRSEVLKIGGATDSPGKRGNRHSSRASLSLPSSGARALLPTILDSHDQTLGIQRHCPQCGEPLHLSIFSTPIAAGRNSKQRTIKTNTPAVVCPNCKPSKPKPVKLPCVICGEVVEGMLIPCLSCGHVCCFDCHRIWFSKSYELSENEPGGNSTPGKGATDQDFQHCPSGCGCRCSEHVVIDLPVGWFAPSPADPGKENSQQPSVKHRNRRPEIRPVDRAVPATGHHEDEPEPWQASPFASLAKGFGGGLNRGPPQREEKRKPRTGLTAVNRKTPLSQVETR
ncbi:hypothetical protein ASPZODRAFT_1216940 [Penicilliopsis zonata CBS 506.65]|uniref:RWD domain-containing protein n=1 Tax=Penicilliopsis zonata CBS 506.65 TaxID=1073090 RepID=A0A1L9S7G8_9EURO|nr:hypothetical protein ASPZODRAFT_1216940 [Penicilliopsis zonata CBS 506.65]OJJ43100.1 hypothetical protein ASPZODRAFT_1216940 [Penicilliopsis zonata CBS 506.65]